jgi:hypothetical protein
MDRVLGLQAVTEFSDSDFSEGCSGTSGTCSSSSTGTGDSGCSINCRETEEFDW